MRLKLVASALIALGGISAVHASEGDLNQLDKSGFWLGVGSGAAFNNNSEVGAGDKEVLSSKLEMGYDFSRNFGLYSSYDYMHNVMDSKLHVGTVGLKGNVFFTENLSLYGKVGASYVFSDGGEQFKTDNFSTTAGVGFEYQLTNAVTTKLGYDYYDDLERKTGNDVSLSQVTLGLTYKFGQQSTPHIIHQEVPVEVVKEVSTNKVSRSSYILPYTIGQVDVNHYGSYSLDEIIEVMYQNPEIKANIIGRTDASGSAQVNAHVSYLRAENVAQYLIDNGVQVDRISFTGISNNEPLTGNADTSLERSVQIILQ